MSVLCPPVSRRSIVSRDRRTGFTLVELLVVMGIILIILGLVVPALTSILGSYKLDAASEDVLAKLNLARQTALATSHPVQVRFYHQTSGTANVWLAIQCFLQGDTATTPLGKPTYFTTPVVLVDNATQINGADPSSLLDSSKYLGVYTPATTDTTYPLPPPYGVTPYVYFLYRPDGQIDQPTTTGVTSNAPTCGATGWITGWLTLELSTAPVQAGSLNANYSTIQVNASTGTIRVYRP